MDKAKFRKDKKNEELDFDELINKFCAKDSESNIQISQIGNSDNNHKDKDNGISNKEVKNGQAK